MVFNFNRPDPQSHCHLVTEKIVLNYHAPGRVGWADPGDSDSEKKVSEYIPTMSYIRSQNPPVFPRVHTHLYYSNFVRSHKYAEYVYNVNVY